MNSQQEKEEFSRDGYLHVPGILDAAHLSLIRSEFDRVWQTESKPYSQHKLLKHQAFIDLIEHPPILDRHRAIFGNRVQLLQYDLLRQGPFDEQTGAVWQRAWHRDFRFPGDYPLSINTILYLDDINEVSGPTYVVPGSHRGPETPPADSAAQPLPDEVELHAAAGDAVFINSAIWHSGGCNRGSGQRRGIYLYYGYWFLKRYESEQTLPWQAFEGASQQRLCLLGLKNPGGNDIHQY